MTPLVKSKGAEKRSHIQRSKAKETEYIPLVKCPPLALEIDRCDLPIRVNRDEVCPSGHARSQLFSCQSRKIAGTLQDHERSVNSLECVQTQADARRAEGPATAGVSWPRSARHPSPVEVRDVARHSHARPGRGLVVRRARRAGRRPGRARAPSPAPPTRPRALAAPPRGGAGHHRVRSPARRGGPRVASRGDYLWPSR